MRLPSSRTFFLSAIALGFLGLVLAFQPKITNLTAAMINLPIGAEEFPCSEEYGLHTCDLCWFQYSLSNIVGSSKLKCSKVMRGWWADGSYCGKHTYIVPIEACEKPPVGDDDDDNDDDYVPPVGDDDDDYVPPVGDDDDDYVPPVGDDDDDNWIGPVVNCFASVQCNQNLPSKGLPLSECIDGKCVKKQCSNDYECIPLGGSCINGGCINYIASQDCGDGIRTQGIEECDHGTAGCGGDGCTDHCTCGSGPSLEYYITPSTCGNGSVETSKGEECENDNDCGSGVCNECKCMRCGNGVVEFLYRNNLTYSESCEKDFSAHSGSDRLCTAIPITDNTSPYDDWGCSVTPDSYKGPTRGNGDRMEIIDRISEPYPSSAYEHILTPDAFNGSFYLINNKRLQGDIRWDTNTLKAGYYQLYVTYPSGGIYPYALNSNVCYSIEIHEAPPKGEVKETTEYGCIDQTAASSGKEADKIYKGHGWKELKTVSLEEQGSVQVKYSPGGYPLPMGFFIADGILYEYLCGNGKIDGAIEECDDGNSVNGDGCSQFCEKESHECGNGIKEWGEECDDGNTIVGDGCDQLCNREYCGDGLIDGNGPDNIAGNNDDEECDDGNNVKGDGCSNVCKEECDATSCDDGNACNGMETCGSDGECDAGTPLQCNDNDICTSDQCNQSSGCINTAITPPPVECVPPVSINGTSGDDDIVIDASNGFTVTIDGQPVPQDLAGTTAVVIDARGGTDTVNIVARSGNEKIETHPGTVTVRDSNNFTFITLTNSENITVNGNGGNDEAHLYDSNGDDTFDAGPDPTKASLFSSNVFKSEVIDVKTIHAYSGNGTDEATLYDSDSNDALNGDDTTLTLNGDGRQIEIHSFDEATAISNAGGTDEASGEVTFPIHLMGEWNGTVAFCGNGTQEGDEECDDGNSVEDDMCNNVCQLPVCGNGVQEGDEECDDGNSVNTDTCNNLCQLPVCGNGVKEGNEECDDGNLIEDDTCNSACQLPVCGNGVQEGNEGCDDGNTDGEDGCSSSCTEEVCDNNIKDIGETCENCPEDVSCGSIEQCCAGGGCMYSCGGPMPLRLSKKKEYTYDTYTNFGYANQPAGTDGIFNPVIANIDGNGTKDLITTRDVFMLGTNFAKNIVSTKKPMPITAVPTSYIAADVIAWGTLSDSFWAKSPYNSSEELSLLFWLNSKLWITILKSNATMGEIRAEIPLSSLGLGGQQTALSARIIGDLDNDGIQEIALSVKNKGSYILFLDDDYALRDHTPISGGSDITPIGDMDGDGIPDIAVLTSGGGVRIIYLTDEGKKKSSETIILGQIINGIHLSLDNVGDMDQNGFTDLVVGSHDPTTKDIQITVLYLGEPHSGNLIPALLDYQSIDLVKGSDNDIYGSPDGIYGIKGAGDMDRNGVSDIFINEDGNTRLLLLNQRPAICGDGKFESGEECDDGNNIDGDGCRANCTLEICGDGELDTDGPDNIAGNEDDEECDDGNEDNTDGCSTICTEIICGNGRADVGENCSSCPEDAACNTGETCCPDHDNQCLPECPVPPPEMKPMSVLSTNDWPPIESWCDVMFDINNDDISDVLCTGITGYLLKSDGTIDSSTVPQEFNPIGMMPSVFNYGYAWELGLLQDSIRHTNGNIDNYYILNDSSFDPGANKLMRLSVDPIRLYEKEEVGLKIFEDKLLSLPQPKHSHLKYPNILPPLLANTDVHSLSRLRVIPEADGSSKHRTLAIGLPGYGNYDPGPGQQKNWEDIGAVILLLNQKNHLYKESGFTSSVTIDKNSITDENALLGLQDNELFGNDVVPIGDLDGNGVTDIAVSAPGHIMYYANNQILAGEKPGRVFLLLLNSNGGIKAARTISAQDVDPTRTAFANELENVGDIDGNGIDDLAVSSLKNGQNNVYILYLKRNPHEELSPFFGYQHLKGYAKVTPVGDIDGNDVPDLHAYEQPSNQRFIEYSHDSNLLFLERLLCGNGDLDEGEECDDKNFSNGDGCSTKCTVEFCGDGFYDPNGPDNADDSGDEEECDDGNNIDGDGCTALCGIGTDCGNNIVEAPEECEGEETCEPDLLCVSCSWQQPLNGEDLGVDEWRVLQTPVPYSPIVSFNDSIVAICAKNALHQSKVFTLQGNNWSAIGTLPVGSERHTAAVADNKMFVFGGNGLMPAAGNQDDLKYFLPMSMNTIESKNGSNWSYDGPIGGKLARDVSSAVLDDSLWLAGRNELQNHLNLFKRDLNGNFEPVTMNREIPNGRLTSFYNQLWIVGREYVYSSENGTKWTAESLVPWLESTGANVHPFVYDGLLWILFDARTTDEYNRLYVSSDGKQWQIVQQQFIQGIKITNTASHDGTVWLSADPVGLSAYEDHVNAAQEYFADFPMTQHLSKTPDKTQYVYVGDSLSLEPSSPNALMFIDETQHTVRVLATPENADLGGVFAQPTISSDGERIAVRQYIIGENSPWTASAEVIYNSSPDSTGVSVLSRFDSYPILTDTLHPETDTVVSPDGKVVAFVEKKGWRISLKAPALITAVMHIPGDDHEISALRFEQNSEHRFLTFIANGITVNASSTSLTFVYIHDFQTGKTQTVVQLYPTEALTTINGIQHTYRSRIHYQHLIDQAIYDILRNDMETCRNNVVDEGENCITCPDDAGCLMAQNCCDDGTCSETCGGVSYCDLDSLCEINENCNCSDCANQQSGCDKYFICKSGLCASAYCGNSKLEKGHGEECDDGNTNDNDACSNECKIQHIAICGDGIVESPEECDDGNTINMDGCSEICKIQHICGDGIVESPEECDDGNTINMDGCSEICKIEIQCDIDSYPIAPPSYFFVTVDLNGDSIEDIAATNFEYRSVSILLGNEDGTFQSYVRYDSGKSPRNIAAGDMDNNGTIDLLIANYQRKTINLLPGNGDGTFGSRIEITDQLSSPLELVVDHYNADEYLDIVISDLEGTHILFGETGTSFTDPLLIHPGSQTHITGGDFDADGNPDVAVTMFSMNNGENDPAVGILLGNGDGTFQDPAVYVTQEYTNPHLLQLTAGDINGDGYTDLAISENNSTISLLINDGDGTFTLGTQLQATSRNRYIKIVDVNNDGNSDIIHTSNSTDTIYIRYGNGDGTFQTTSFSRKIVLPQKKGGYFELGDFNDDSITDLVVHGDTDNSISVLLGDLEECSNVVVVSNLCGNGTVEGEEMCDDGNIIDEDGCSAICNLEGGNLECTDPDGDRGHYEYYIPSTTSITLINGSPASFADTCVTSNKLLEYQCNITGRQILFRYKTCGSIWGGCQNGACKTSARCGNGVLEKEFNNEECDDGNTENGDGCDEFCRLPCDQAGQDATGNTCCDGRLSVIPQVSIANGICLLPAPGIICSDCGNSTCEQWENFCNCPTDCREPSICGNGIMEVGEQCDDGNTDIDDGCSSECQLEEPLQCLPL